MKQCGNCLRAVVDDDDPHELCDECEHELHGRYCDPYCANCGAPVDDARTDSHCPMCVETGAAWMAEEES